MRTSIADRYILKEILAPFLLAVGAFVVILIGDILYTLAEFVATRRMSLEVFLRLLIYKMPAIMVITFPVATLFGALLGLGRLANDHEVQAMRLAGMSLLRIFSPVLLFGLLIAGVTFSTNEYVAPWANHQANNLIRRAVYGEAFPQIREQIFFRAPGGRFFYVDRADDRQRQLHNVMIYEAGGPVPKLITAREATWTDQYWSLRDGVVREFDTEGFTRYEVRFARMEVLIGVDSGTFFAGQKTPEEMTARELRRYLILFGHSHATARFAIEYHRKFSIPFAGAVFALIAAPLGVRVVQGGRFLSVGVSIGVLFVYYAVMSITRAMGGTGAIDPAAAAWAPNFLFGLAGVFLWAYEEGWLKFPVRAAQMAGPQLP